MHGKEGLDARGIKVGGRLIWKLDQPPEGLVDLSFGQVSRLVDTMPSWPSGKYALVGLNYSPTMGSPDEVPVDQRLAWLRRTMDYAGTAYEQLAQAYKLSGQENTAEKVSIASLQDLRSRGNLRGRARAWNKFLDVTVGYGYRLHRPFVALLVLGLLGTFFYYLGERAGVIYAISSSQSRPAPACHPGYPCFYPVAYSFQLLVPGLDLRQASYWFPSSDSKPLGLLLMLYTWVMIVLGWVLATAVVAGITQLFRRR
jgi:hypothetical protein